MENRITKEEQDKQNYDDWQSSLEEDSIGHYLNR